MRWRNREQTVKYKFYLKQEACLWIWNTLKHSPNFRCPSKPMSFLKCFLSSGEWSFPSLSESLSCSSLWSLIWKPFCFRATRFYLKEVLAEMIELFWEKKRNPVPSPFSTTYFSGWSWTSLFFRPPSQLSSFKTFGGESVLSVEVGIFG